MPFLPAVSAIGGHIQAINEVVVIRDQIVLSNRHLWISRDDFDISPIDVDRSGNTIDLFSQEGVGYIQVRVRISTRLFGHISQNDFQERLMFLRAVLAFLALPAVVGGVLPWVLLGNDPWRMRGTSFGWPLVLFGAAVLMWCVFDFYRIGRGTLAPWDPPKKLVILGLYRFMRNPMYLSLIHI